MTGRTQWRSMVLAHKAKAYHGPRTTNSTTNLKHSGTPVTNGYLQVVNGGLWDVILLLLQSHLKLVADLRK